MAADSYDYPTEEMLRKIEEKSFTKARPGHADYSFDAKYGMRDHRGGGRSSGRETIGRVAAGAIAIKLLNQMGISFLTYWYSSLIVLLIF